VTTRNNVAAGVDDAIRVAVAAGPGARAVAILDASVDLVVGTALVGELVAVITDVLGRYFFDSPLLWTDEVSSLALSIIAFIGGAIAYRREQHVFIRTIVDLLPERPRHACYAFVDWVVLGIAVICCHASLGVLTARWDETTPILEMRGTWLALPLTIGMVVLALYALIRLGGQKLHAVVSGGLVAAGMTAAIMALHLWWLPALSTGAAVSVALLAVLVTALLGLPIGFALILGTLAFLYTGGLVSLVALPQNMVDGVSRFVLLALPFFILAGFVMESGGISRRLVMFVASLVGRLRGGLLQVTVVSMYIVSGISGSKAADVAAVGLVMRDMLDEEGYDTAEAAAVLAASAAMGECVPPSIAMLVLGSITSLSMGALFAAGLIPAAVIAVCLMLLIYWRSPRDVTQSPVRLGMRRHMRLATDAIIPASMPAFLFVGIFTGFATPTEVSAFAVAYGLLIAVFLYGELRLRSLARIIASASTVAAMVLFTLAAAQAFSWVLSAAQVPQALADLLAAMHDNAALFLVSSIVGLVVLGSLLEGLPALLILAPLLLPLTPALGISQLHYGIVLLIAMGIGAFLPPLGVGFYIACAVARAPMGRATRIMMPYVVVLLLGLLVVAFVPWLTLVFPRALGLAGTQG
jgi:tripartite ATP-independent transporter DctM subunit